LKTQKSKKTIRGDKKMFSRISKAVPFVLVMALLAINVVPALAAPSNQAMDDIVDIAVADGRFTTLVAAVQAAAPMAPLPSYLKVPSRPCWLTSPP
jgi:hypothetical protein